MFHSWFGGFALARFAGHYALESVLVAYTRNECWSLPNKSYDAQVTHLLRAAETQGPHAAVPLRLDRRLASGRLCIVNRIHARPGRAFAVCDAPGLRDHHRLPIRCARSRTS